MNAITTRPAARTWHTLALLALCAAYLQGGLAKLLDFGAAVAEMQHFGLRPAAPLAAAVIALELGASLLVIAGRWRWAGALALGVFTLVATTIANPFWAMAGAPRIDGLHAFVEHLGLAGGFALVAWHDRLGPRAAS